MLSRASIAALILLLLSTSISTAYVEAPMSLGAVIAQSSHILTMRVEKVDKEKNLIIFRKVQDLKGQHPGDVIKHIIGRGGFHPREWQFIMEWAEPGKTAVFFHNGGASETCISNYWYQAYAGGEWWNMSHGEPYLLRSFAGNPDKLAAAVTSIVAGQEVVVPCMVDGDKNTLQTRAGKIQRLKASLKIQDYNPKRDFAGWGGEDFRLLAGMPAFTHYAAVNRVDPGSIGISSDDFDGDGKPDLCLYGASKVALLQNSGTSFNEVSLPGATGARAAVWADYHGDGKPDLFLATPGGPRLFANHDGSFKDETAALPQEPYYNLTAAAWLDADVDGRQDLLISNGFLGLRLYRNRGSQAAAAVPLVMGKWHCIGPFDNPGQRGFDQVYPPEKEIDLAKMYDGKGGTKAAWQAMDFKDGETINLAIFGGDLDRNATAYLYREIQASTALDIPASFGSDDTLTVWLNGQKIVAENVYRPLTPDQTKATLKLKPGKNTLLIKVCQGEGEWAFQMSAAIPPVPVPLYFEDGSARWGLGTDGIGSRQKHDHLAVADVNGDGRPDFLYGNVLVLNTPQGFVESKDAGLAFAPTGITPLFVDIDGDKDVDLFVPQTGVCKLFKNDGKCRFTDVTSKAGELSQPIGQATSAAAIDFNKDGRLDLFVGCLKGTNRLFLNQEDGTFVDASERIGLQQRIFNTRSLLVLDLNRDGAPDLVMNNEGQESVVLLGRVPQVALKDATP
jgi:hypothetical protein